MLVISDIRVQTGYFTTEQPLTLGWVVKFIEIHTKIFCRQTTADFDKDAVTDRILHLYAYLFDNKHPVEGREQRRLWCKY